LTNYYASARSNYFSPDDRPRLERWAQKFGIEIVDGTEPGSVTLLASEEGWPSWHCDEETSEERDIDIAEELGELLKPGETAVLLEVGAEKLRYVVGYAVAIHRKIGGGVETERLSLDEIYTRAETRWGAQVSRAEL
jgi:hypothetical protein